MKNISRHKPRHLLERLVVPVTEISQQVSAPLPAIKTQAQLKIDFSINQLRLRATAERRRLTRQKRPEVCTNIIVESALLHHTPAAKRARRGTLLGDQKEATEKFGTLKVVLGTVPAVYANREVRSYLPSKYSPLTRHCQQGSAAVGNRIKLLLSHVVSLEEYLDSRPGDVVEQRRRDELIWYIPLFPL